MPIIGISTITLASSETYTTWNSTSMACDFRTVIDWIILVALIVLAIAAFICWAMWGSLWIDGFFRCVFIVVSCIFTGCAPFGWIGIVGSLFAYMNAPFWRSCFVIVLSCWYFPHFNDGYWDDWYVAFVSIAAIVCFVCGVIELVLDCINACCGGNCGPSQGGSSNTHSSSSTVMKSAK